MKRTTAARSTQPVAAENAAVSGGPAWTFLTNHAHVLLCIYRDSGIRLREVARMVQKIVAELAEAGYLAVEKEGRCNRYEVQRSLRLRHPLESQHAVGRLLDLLRRDA